MSELQTRIQLSNSLWRGNPALVHLFGLSPLLAVADSAATGLALGVLALVTLCISAMACSLLKLGNDKPWRYIVFLLIAATATTGLEWLTMHFFTGIYAALNIYIVLLCSNFIVLLSFAEFSNATSPQSALARGLRLSGGYLLACVLFGALREIIFTGQLLSDWRILLPDSSNYELIYLMPVTLDQAPGKTLPFALILLGLLLALGNVVQQFVDRRAAVSELSETLKPKAPTVQRARVTGKLHKQATSETDAIATEESTHREQD